MKRAFVLLAALLVAPISAGLMVTPAPAVAQGSFLEEPVCSITVGATTAVSAASQCTMTGPGEYNFECTNDVYYSISGTDAGTLNRLVAFPGDAYGPLKWMSSMTAANLMFLSASGSITCKVFRVWR